MRGRLILMCAILAMASCRTITKIVPVESVKTETRFVTEHLHDTTIIKDSIWVKEKGDTIYIDRWHTRDRVVLTNKVDSFIRIDTIPHITEVQVPTRIRNGYDRFTSWGFWILALLLLIRVAWWVFKTFYLRR